MNQPEYGALDDVRCTPREDQARRLVERGDGAGLERMMTDSSPREIPVATIEHAVGSWLEVARAFNGMVTRDGSWGELDKRLQILFRNMVNSSGGVSDPSDLLRRAFDLLMGISEFRLLRPRSELGENAHVHDQVDEFLRDYDRVVEAD